EGGAIVNGHLNVAGGHVSSQQAEQFNGLLGSLQGASLSQAQASIGQADIAQRQLRMQERLDFELGLEQTHYSDPQSGLGHAEFIRRLGFSFRTEQQYGSEGYELPEMHWQHQAGSTGATWT